MGSEVSSAGWRASKGDMKPRASQDLMALGVASSRVLEPCPRSGYDCPSSFRPSPLRTFQGAFSHSCCQPEPLVLHHVSVGWDTVLPASCENSSRFSCGRRKEVPLYVPAWLDCLPGRSLGQVVSATSVSNCL